MPDQVRHDGRGSRGKGVLDLWFLIPLRRSELAQLKAELRAFVERFDRGSRPGARPYLVHAAAAPKVRDL